MLKLLSKPTKAESIYCMIRIPIIDVIVAELLLETMKEEGKKISTMKQKPFIPSNSIMQILKAHDTLFTIQMHYSLVDCVICLLWNIFLSMCPDSVKDKSDPRGWKHWLHPSWKVIQFVWYLFAMNFNVFNILLTDYVWAFSIDLDSGNKSNQSYVDVCICFSLDCQVYNLHLIAIPIHERHTGLNMYNLIKKSWMHCAVDGKISSLVYKQMEPLI